jgi:hypothetical protein
MSVRGNDYLSPIPPLHTNVASSVHEVSLTGGTCAQSSILSLKQASASGGLKRMSCAASSWYLCT